MSISRPTRSCQVLEPLTAGRMIDAGHLGKWIWKPIVGCQVGLKSLIDFTGTSTLAVEIGLSSPEEEAKVGTIPREQNCSQTGRS